MSLLACPFFYTPTSFRRKMYHLIGVRCIIFQRTLVDVFLHGFYLTLFSLINDICRQI